MGVESTMHVYDGVGLAHQWSSVSNPQRKPSPGILPLDVGIALGSLSSEGPLEREAILLSGSFALSAYFPEHASAIDASNR